MLRENKELYEFDKFRLDVSERFLLRNGKRVALADRAFDTLCVLVRHGNRLVSKNELMTEVWADAIVEENNLDKNISVLRRILGERNGKQRFIETVRGHGYRFVAEVRRVDGDGAERQGNRDAATRRRGDAEISEQPPALTSELNLSELPATASALNAPVSNDSSLEFQIENLNGGEQATNEHSIEEQSPKTTDRIENSKFQIPNRKSNVVALAAWRHEIGAGDEASTAEPAVVNEIQKEPILKVVPSDAVPKIKSNRLRRAALAICAVLVTTGIGYALYKFANPSPMIFEAGKTTRITATGKVKLAAVSPDGKLIAYSQEENGEQQSLWMRHITSESSVQIAPLSSVEYRGLNISPDGNSLYYIVGQGTLYQMPVLGGAAKKIADGLYTSTSIGVDVGISPDSKQIAFVRRFKKEASALFIVNADGTNERTLAAFEQPVRLGESVAWSPNGRVIACREITNGKQNIIAVQVADGTSALILPQGRATVLKIVWMPDSKSLLMSGGAGGQIYRIFYPSGEEHPINFDGDYGNGIGLTTDGRFLAKVKTETAAHVWTMPSGNASRAKQLTAGFNKLDGVFELSWIPDGRVVYNSNTESGSSIWSAEANGSNSKQLLENQATGSISSDGRFIIYQKGLPVTDDVGLWKMDVSDGRDVRLTNIAVIYQTFSPDGKWLVFTRFAERVGLWKMPSAGGEPTLVLDENAICPTVSPDGKTIAFIWRRAGETNRIALVSFDGGEVIKSFDAKLEGNGIFSKQNLQWTADGRGIYFIGLTDGVSNIWRQPIDGGQPEQVTNFTTGRIFNFAFSPDGSQLALSRGTINSDVVLIENAK